MHTQNICSSLSNSSNNILLSFLFAGEDGTRQGHRDLSTDNERQHKPFFEVKGQGGEKEEDTMHSVNESDRNCTERISDLRATIKR